MKTKITSETRTSDFEQGITFLSKIGIPIRLVDFSNNSFFSGVWFERITLCINTDDVDIGELFHEAGHYAVLPSRFRPYLKPGDIGDYIEESLNEYFNLCRTTDDFDTDTEDYRAIIQSGETEAIAWSYAAAITAGIAPHKIFETGFDKEGLDVLSCLERKSYLGINGLHHGGMCDMRKFPQMKRWLQV